MMARVRDLAQKLRVAPGAPPSAGAARNDSVAFERRLRRRNRLLGGGLAGGRRGPLRLNEAGFTLIELLVVMIVLGLLVGLVGPRLFGRVGQSKTAAARAQIELLGAALDQFRLDVGKYPDSGQGLEALQQNPNVPSWNGPYLKKNVPKDPWGEPYKYRCCPGQHGEYDLWSEGGDKQPGGEGENADVTSWESGSS